MVVNDVGGGHNAEETLDLTGSHLHDLEDVELLGTLKALDLTLNRLRVLDPRILALTGLQTLSFRQNLLSDASQLEICASKAVLQELILHDNHLTQIPDLAGFVALQRLELSYNSVQSMEPLTRLDSTALHELYIANNALPKLEGLRHLTDLRLLELGSNRIRQMEGLQGLVSLQELWLGRNRISSISSLDGFSGLQKLSLQSNRLTSMEGLGGCQHLEELYLSHNGIACLQGLASLSRLKILDVSNNKVSEVEGLEHLHHLQDLWLNDNRVASLAQLDVNSPMRQTLTCLYISGNPCVAQSNSTGALMQMFPSLQQLDDKVL